jgi:putative hydrolase of the HAD superfamily
MRLDPFDPAEGASVERIIDAVLFDLDNTLFDRDLVFTAWARSFVRERLCLIDETEIEEAARVIIDIDASGYVSRTAFAQALKDRYEVLTEPIDRLVTIFRDQLVAHMPPLDGATERLLSALERAGIPWGIITNGSPSQLNKIRSLGLESRAGCVLVSEIVGIRKPDPAIFHEAAELLGILPANILFVGDNAAADIGGAHGAGMQTAWLHRGREWPEDPGGSAPHHSIASLADLIPVVVTRL